MPEELCVQEHKFGQYFVTMIKMYDPTLNK